MRPFRPLIHAIALLWFSFGLIPVLSGCSDNNGTSSKPDLSQEEAKKKADQETYDAFQAQMKKQKR